MLKLNDVVKIGDIEYKVKAGDFIRGYFLWPVTHDYCIGADCPTCPVNGYIKTVGWSFCISPQFKALEELDAFIREEQEIKLKGGTE